MGVDYNALRIEGIYNQNEAGQLMMRVKLASGLLSVAQAAVLARLGQQYGSGTLHLSTRGSVEFHDLELEQLPQIQRQMATVGLFSRGACGGAVRGISTSTGFGRGFHFTQILGRKLLLHFSGNPHFEGLPKKFKIAVEADYEGSRHLIQDLAFVFVDQEDGQAFYDIWTGGGLGRLPQAAILYRQRVPEAELLPLAESIVRVYRDNVLPPKRLKSLISTRGEEEFRRLVAEELAQAEPVQFRDAFDKTLLPMAGDTAELKLVVPISFGDLRGELLGKLAAAAAAAGVDYMLVTADQNLALLPPDQQSRQQLVEALTRVGFAGIDQPCSVLRVCPGNHECSMGLAATRELAGQLHQRFAERLNGRHLAISGCANSCAQPQVAEIGIIASKSIKGEDGLRTPRFDLYRRSGEALGERFDERKKKNDLITALDAEL